MATRGLRPRAVSEWTDEKAGLQPIEDAWRLAAFWSWSRLLSFYAGRRPCYADAEIQLPGAVDRPFWLKAAEDPGARAQPEPARLITASSRPALGALHLAAKSRSTPTS